jgi:hypothetical protein
MCGKCDNPEGNLCRKCEDVAAAVTTPALYDDGWWPMMQVGARSINIASMTAAEELGGVEVACV